MKAMKAVILTVDPAATTVGALHPEACMKLMRRKVDVEGATIARRKSGGLLRTLFGPTSMSPSRSRMMLAVRVLFGACLIFHGVMQIGSSVPESVFSMGVGLMLMLGLATRFVMIASGVCFGLIAGMAVEHGVNMQADIMLSVMSIAMAMGGPGGYSADAVLRRKIFRSIRRYETRKLMERRFSYKAYEYAHL